MSRARTFNDRGFGLVEMAITLLLVAVLVTLAQPSFSAYLANAQIRTGGEALLNGVQLARAEAVRRNNAVQFALAADTGWTVSLVASGEMVQSRSANDGSPNARTGVTPDGAVRLTFNGFGGVVPNPDASASITQIEINNPAGGTCVAASGQMRCLQVRVSAGGDVRLCDPTYSAGDPRAC